MDNLLEMDGALRREMRKRKRMYGQSGRTRTLETRLQAPVSGVRN